MEDPSAGVGMRMVRIEGGAEMKDNVTRIEKDEGGEVYWFKFIHLCFTFLITM